MIKGTLPSQESYIEKPKRFSMVANDGFQRLCVLSPTHMGQVPYPDRVLREYTALRCTTEEKSWLKRKQKQKPHYIFLTPLRRKRN